MTVVSFNMAYRSFQGGSGRLDTRLDTPPSINRRHPNSCLALFSNPIASAVLAHFEVMQGKHGRRRKAGHLRSANLLFLSLSRAANTIGRRSLCCETLSVSLALTSHKRLKLHHPERHSRAACLLGDIWASYPPMA